MTRCGLLLLACALSVTPAQAQQANTRSVLEAGRRPGAPVLRARAIQGDGPTVDGDLGDPAWRDAPIATGFRQLRPDEGDPATERSEVRVLYGEDALFIAFRAFESDPGAIEAQMTRRDRESYSDRVHVAIDSYNDRRTAFHFAVNPVGVKADYYRFDDTAEDVGWDAVWDVATKIDDEGWTAEFRIPYSQLRFADGDVQNWGIQFMREIARNREESFWSPISGDDNAMVSRFGELQGLEGISPPRRLEVAPYTLARLQRAPGNPDDPFHESNDTWGTVGMDVKYGLTSNLTLDVTVNPDFGQVEADPAQVNLTAFETFLPEQRPFFLEGSSIFNFSIALGDGDGANESLFYSRRIGRAPQGFVNRRGGFTDAPDNTTIQSAAKLSGKTESGWSIGLMHASTSSENARVFSGDGDHFQDLIEPSTQYGLARIQRDFRGGRSALGVIATGVFRPEADAAELALHSNAITGGIDFRHRFGGENYSVTANVLGSRVSGSADAIARTQRAPGRYLNRGADHLTYDPTRTSMEGMSAFASFAKVGGGFWRYSTGIQMRSPEFEVNDIGYMRDVDYWTNWVWVAHNHYLPTEHFRRWQVNFNAWQSYSFGGERTSLGGNVNANFQLHNYWNGYLGFNVNGPAISRTLLRGGPAIETETRYNAFSGFGTDGRKALRFNMNLSGSRAPETDSWSLNLSPSLNWRPSGRAQVSMGTFFNRNVNDRQWVGRVTTDSDHYLFGRIDQQTVGLTGRLDFAFTPNLSLQLYAQPFVSSGSYGELKRVVDPTGDSYADRYAVLDAEAVEGGWATDLDGNGDTEFVPDPDFNFKQFRSNAVLRWEFRPGSTLFLVWSQGRNHFTQNGDFDLTGDLGTLFDQPADNIFLVKFSYWLNP